MDTYRLYGQHGKTVKEGSLASVLGELLSIRILMNGEPKFIAYNKKEQATEIRYEGYYCDFSIF